MKGYPLIWTEEEKKIIYDNYKILQKKDIVIKLKEELGVERSVMNLKCFYHKFKLNSGMTGYFEKGCTPPNKGKKMSPEQYAKCKATMFKKGSTPKNTLPVGSEVYQNRDRKSGKTSYWYVKVAEPNVWEPKHRLLWESVYGPIPEGANIMFLDGDTNNICIENLRMITKADSAVLNKQYGKENLTADERNIAVDVVQIERKAKQRIKN